MVEKRREGPFDRIRTIALVELTTLWEAMPAPSEKPPYANI
jgi:hypothetical protein